MRVALTGLSGRRRPTNSPRKSRLAAISLGHKQPKTHLEVGTKKPGRSCAINSLTHRGTKTPSGHSLLLISFTRSASYEVLPSHPSFPATSGSTSRFNTHENSLNSVSTCLKVVDMRRIAPYPCDSPFADE